MSSIRNTLSAALFVIDDFTNDVASCPLDIRANLIHKAVRKEDGYYLFMGIDKEQMEITISAPIYTTYHLIIKQSDLDALNPIVKVRIKPNKLYPLPAGTKCLSGKGTPGEELLFVVKQERSYLKLLFDYEGDSQIALYQTGNEDLDGQQIYIEHYENHTGEVGRICSTINSEKYLYQLETPFSSTYLKNTTKIYLVIKVIVDAEGTYYHPLKNGIELEQISLIR
ncbi:MAG: hypothetical protein RR275_04895 [Lachnospiraceae bacterium]